jgi:hypothetical protein
MYVAHIWQQMPRKWDQILGLRLNSLSPMREFARRYER